MAVEAKSAGKPKKAFDQMTCRQPHPGVQNENSGETMPFGHPHDLILDRASVGIDE